MRGVGPGTVLGGRYAVHRRLEQLRDTERWSADDQTLGRRVSVLVIAADDHRTPALLDAARRAASVSHVVFARILDVGTDDDVAYVVEEDLSDARTLTELVTGGGVPGDEVRRITGEVAAALETARQRGMHHLALEPDDVLRTPEGDVRLRGLETAAVRAGDDGAEAEEGARRDAVGVVALAYAGLTGLWPLGSGGSGLAAAPRVPGGVAAPSEIAAGVPRDLDAICRLTINDDQGPTSPGDYARQVAPWPSRQVIGRPVARAAPTERPDPLDEDPHDDDRTADHASVDEVVPFGGGAAPVSGAPEDDLVGSPAGPAPVDPSPGRGARSPLDPADDPEATVIRELPRLTPASDVPEAPGAADDLGDVARPEETKVIALPGAASARRLPARRDPAELTQDDRRSLERAAADRSPGAAPDDGGDEDDERTGAVATAAAGAAAAGAAVAGALGTVGGRVGSLARRAVDKVSELSPDTARETTAVDRLEAPAPLVPADPLTKDESKLALGIVAGFLVLALVIGIWGVTRIGANTDGIGLGAPGSSRTPTATASPSPSASASASGSEAPTGNPEPLAILKVEPYDPEGDGEENNSLAPKAYDGDPKDAWFSENYRSDEFGGLKKGLGVVVDLGPNKKPQGVELAIPVRSDVEVYVGPENRLEGATKIGTKKDAEGTVTFTVPPEVSGQYIVVWYTKLSEDDRGKRRAWLGEVVVTG